MIIVKDLGYYHPSNANWSYHIHLIIDETGARLYRETFGGDSRMIAKMDEQGVKMENLYAGNGSGVSYKWSDIKDLMDIENYTGVNYGKEGN